jgi:DNA repair exonuclease SbcCD nuclease subunit
MDLRLLHFADSHLRDCDLDEIRSCLSFVARQARAEKPDLIVCAGDVFDSQHVRLDSLSAKTAFEIFSELADIAPVAVVGGTPSHEGTATEVFRHISARNDIHVSIVAEQLVLWDKHLFPLSEVDPYGVPPNIAVISMVPAFTKQFLKTGSDVHTSDAEAAAMVANLLAGFGAVASAWDCPHILVGHFPVGGALVSSTQMLTGVDVEVSRDMLALADADLICLGHIHKAQRVGEKAFYSG